MQANKTVWPSTSMTKETVLLCEFKGISRPTLQRKIMLAHSAMDCGLKAPTLKGYISPKNIAPYNNQYTF
jgi:hypothetical protein